MVAATSGRLLEQFRQFSSGQDIVAIVGKLSHGRIKLHCKKVSFPFPSVHSCNTTWLGCPAGAIHLGSCARHAGLRGVKIAFQTYIGWNNSAVMYKVKEDLEHWYDPVPHWTTFLSLDAMSRAWTLPILLLLNAEQERCYGKCPCNRSQQCSGGCTNYWETSSFTPWR